MGLGFWPWNFQFHIIFQNFHGWKLVFPIVSKVKVTNLKIPAGGFQKTISTIQPVWSFSGIDQWTDELHPKSQITILVAWQLELFQKEIPNREDGWGRVFHRWREHGGLWPPIEVGLFKIWWGRLESIDGGSMGGLKTLSKNIQKIHLLVRLPCINQQACKFTKNELLHTYFSRILARF